MTWVSAACLCSICGKCLWLLRILNLLKVNIYNFVQEFCWCHSHWYITTWIHNLKVSSHISCRYFNQKIVWQVFGIVLCHSHVEMPGILQHCYGKPNFIIRFMIIQQHFSLSAGTVNLLISLHDQLHCCKFDQTYI